MIRALIKNGKRKLMLIVARFFGVVFAIKGRLKGYDSITLDNFISKAYIETDAINGIYDSGLFPFIKEIIRRTFAMIR